MCTALDLIYTQCSTTSKNSWSDISEIEEIVEKSGHWLLYMTLIPSFIFSIPFVPKATEMYCWITPGYYSWKILFLLYTINSGLTWLHSFILYIYIIRLSSHENYDVRKLNHCVFGIEKSLNIKLNTCAILIIWVNFLCTQCMFVYLFILFGQ